MTDSVDTNESGDNGRAKIQALRPHYRSGKASLAREFFEPCLQNAFQYRRAAGYFSSSALVTWVAALPRLARHEELSIQVIACPNLSSEDVATINNLSDPTQRSLYETMIVDRILEDILKFAESPGDIQLRARIFAWLLANKKLSIKFAFPNHIQYPGIFHEKIGIFDFPWGGRVAFTGSANETFSGHLANYESIDVYRSWVEAEKERVEVKLDQFEEAWQNKAHGLTVHSPSPRVLERLKATSPEHLPKFTSPELGERWVEEDDTRWKHQKEAVAQFLSSSSGILEMATGTGKTRTALKILEQLFTTRQITSGIITTDGVDLLNQWAEELDKWVMNVGLKILLYRHYSEHHELSDFVLDPKEAILVVSREQVRSVFARLPQAARHQMIIVHDEVHGLGAPGMRRMSGEHQHFGFRLGLSATPERAYDSEGNRFIDAEIGPTIFRFPLEAAIARGVLCEFDYIALEYHLTDNDKERLQQVYARRAARAREGNPMTQEEVWIELSKVYKTAEMKPDIFAAFVSEHQNILENAIIFVETTEYGNRLLPIIHKYTHLYRTYYAGIDREHLVQFSRGEIDCLITCHRISQGIDIRALNGVILFSSARSQLETIQRIGRCLRIDPQKPDKRALIVDFVRAAEDADAFLNADQDRYHWLSKLAQSRRGQEIGTGP